MAAADFRDPILAETRTHVSSWMVGLAARLDGSRSHRPSSPHLIMARAGEDGGWYGTGVSHPLIVWRPASSVRFIGGIQLKEIDMEIIEDDLVLDDLEIEAVFDTLDWMGLPISPMGGTQNGYTCGTGNGCGTLTSMGCGSSIVPTPCGNTGSGLAMCIPCL